MNSSTRLLRTALPRLARPTPSSFAACTCRSAAPAPAPISRRAFATSTPSRSDASLVNIIHADAARAMVSIASLTPTAGFTLSDGLVVPAPIIIINGVVFLWDVGPPDVSKNSWEGFNEDKLKIFEMVTPRPDIVLVGTGRVGLFPPPAFKKYLNGLGIQVDVLDSRNASSTYNLLAEEGRRVGAVLYPTSELSARTGSIQK